jgi:NTP pyrophosphatase (non-canonical NTP hydrolase)
MIEEIEKKVIDWAIERGIAFSANKKEQALKMVEEVGEVCSAILRNDKAEIEDGIGDVMVTLIILAHQNDLDISKCLNTAWNVIKDRKGRTLNGTFIKREDL